MATDKKDLPREVFVFRIVFFFLTLQFAIPALSYLVAPEIAVGEMDRLNRWFGGGPYVAQESTGHLWHMLAVGNVMTLAFMCGLLLADLRRFYPVLPALAFLKGFSALFSLGLGLSQKMPIFLSVFVLDSVTTAAMVFFAVRAHRSLVHASATV